MSDRAAIRAGAVGAVLAAICCATPLLAVGLPLAGLGAWLTGTGLVVLPLIAVGLGLIAWGLYRRRTKAACCKTEIHEEGLKP